jgi:hypothetical protein
MEEGGRCEFLCDRVNRKMFFILWEFRQEILRAAEPVRKCFEETGQFGGLCSHTGFFALSAMAG